MIGSKEKIQEVVTKYSGKAEIVPDALKTCNLGKPNITKSEKINGSIVYTSDMQNNMNSNLQLNIENLNSGIYILKLEIGGELFIWKLIKN